MRRHYTVADCMKPALYKEYLSVLNKALNGQSSKINEELLKKRPGEVCVTLKNYKKARGLSTILHGDLEKNHTYEIKGPMGKGINPVK